LYVKVIDFFPISVTTSSNYDEEWAQKFACHDHTYTNEGRGQQRKTTVIESSNEKRLNMGHEPEPAEIWPGWNDLNKKHKEEVDFWKNSNNENKRLHEMAIAQVKKLETELQKRTPKNSTQGEIITEFQKIAGKLLTKKQLHILMSGAKKVKWNPEDISRAFALRYFSMSAYTYMKKSDAPRGRVETFLIST
jgi:Transposase protein